MIKNIRVATTLHFAGATILCRAAASAQAQAPIEVANNARYVILGDSLHQALPASCDKAFHYRWYKNGVSTGVTTADYIVEPNTNMAGKTYTYQRTALCGGCLPFYRSPLLEILATDPVNPPTIDCRQAKVSGTYMQYSNAQRQGNHVTLNVSSTNPQSVSWTAETSGAKGFYFKGSGTLNKGQNTITLNAYGSPETSGYNHLDVKLHAGNHHIGTSCKFDTYVTTSIFSIAIMSNTNGAWCQSCPDAAIPMMIMNRSSNGFFDNPKYCQTGLVKYTTAPSTISSSNILFWGYDVNFTAAHRSTVAQYVKSGKPAILCIGTENYVRRADYESWISSNFGNVNVVTTYSDVSDGVPFVAGSPVVLGPYMNIVGKKLYPDAKGNIDFTNVDENVWWIIAGRKIGGTRYARAIMHKQYPLILIGDGGALSGGFGYRSDDAQPVEVNYYGVPVPCITSGYPHPGAYNGQLLLNALMWGINKNAGK